MSQLFGQFLIDEKLISPDQLLKALIHQLRSTPSTAEILFDGNLLSQEDQLRILAHQQIHGQDHRSSARELGLWNQALSEAVSQKIQTSRRSIGEILMGLGFLTSDSFAKAFHSYIESTTNTKNGATRPVSLEVAAPALLVPILAPDFASTLNRTIIPALSNIAAGSVLSTRAHVDVFLRKVLAELAPIKAAAKFVDATQAFKYISEVMDSFSAVLASEGMPNPEALIETVTICVQDFTELSRRIEAQNFEENETSHELFQASLRSIQTRLRSVGVEIKVA